MKKNSFMKGAFIVTFGIFITKFLGVIYVIPFYPLIGDKGGELYGYAYNIYVAFLGLSSVGIPLAISKLISEYNTKEYFFTKERAYKVGKIIMTIMGLVTFISLFVLAPLLAKGIGQMSGGVTIKEITLVIRIISTAIIVVPILSVTRGYLQGHKYLVVTSTSQILEQLVRVFVIVVGSYIVVKKLNLGTTLAVSVAVFGATAGALFSYIYLELKIKKNRKLLQRDQLKKREEEKFTTKDIVIRILMYAIPFVVIDLSNSAYNMVNVFTMKNVLSSLNYSVKDVQVIVGVITAWGSSLNTIILAISSGLVISLIPTITSSFVRKDMNDVRKKINQTLQILTYIALPMAIGLSILARPVWMVFYGTYGLASDVYAFYVFVALTGAYYSTSIIIMQAINKYKVVFSCLLAGVATKVIFQIPFMTALHNIGINAFYGSILATICGYVIATIIMLTYFSKVVKVNYDETLKRAFSIIGSLIIMTIVLLLLQIVVPLDPATRIQAMLLAGLYASAGAAVYLTITLATGTTRKILGDKFMDSIFKSRRNK